MQLMHKHAKPLFCCSTWQLLKGAVGNAVDIAVRAGYRHIDGAWIYLNEEEIGTALEGLFKEGVVKREEIFITSKLWCDVPCFISSNCLFHLAYSQGRIL